MKRGLFLTAIIAIFGVATLSAEGIIRTGVYTEGGTLHFVKPTTQLGVKLTIEYSQFEPGEFARYAQSMLGVRASLAARSSAKIVGVSIASGKFDAVVPTSVKADESVMPTSSLPVFRLDGRSMTVEQQARAAADLIFSLRRHRKDLITGEMGENVFGAGLRSALDEIDKMESECLALFYGKTQKSVKEYLYPVTPRAGELCYMLCRFRNDAGVLPLEDLSGDAIMLTIIPGEADLMGANVATPKDKVKVEYAFPAPCKCTLTSGTDVIGEGEALIYQYGKVLPIIPPSK